VKPAQESRRPFRPAGPPAADARGEGGVGRRSSAQAEMLSDFWRRHDDPLLRHRRQVTGLALGAAGALGVVSLYQVGILKHVPEPPITVLDADRVDASGEAYTLGSMPDGLIGVASFALTAVLATLGGPDRHRRTPWLPIVLAAKVAADAFGSGLLTAEQATRHRRYCSWCLTAAGASIAMIPAALPEARAAWRTLRRRAG